MNFKEYLKKYKEKMGVSNEYIASQLGVNRSTVTRWLKGDTKVTNPEVIEKLSFILGVDVESLINSEERYEKPVLGEVKAGYDLLIDENFEGYEQVTQDDYYRGDFFLRVVGDSMSGAHIHDGDLLYVKKCNDVPSGTIAVVLINRCEVTVKKVVKKEGLLILEPANPSVDIRYYSQEEVESLPVEIIGKALYSRSDLV
ncbi:helix-turn-helix domain-containing protein [Coprobacillus sp. K06]|uniref:LexA family protein n=1 Tax=Coprobacillus sp. K06 TaxID=2718930 RepID=UPI001C8C367E|nr:S24 family peptidase [Coprobacillus sp. K06]MBX9164559.1 helix-turn-helix domain-containing protein [Coprobacillus sp. K06]